LSNFLTNSFFYEYYSHYEDLLLTNQSLGRVADTKILYQDYDHSLSDKQNLWKVVFNPTPTFYELIRIFLLKNHFRVYSPADAFDWFYTFLVEERIPPLTRMKIEGLSSNKQFTKISNLLVNFGGQMADRMVQGYDNLEEYLNFDPKPTIVIDDHDVPLPTITLGDVNVNIPNLLALRNYLIDRKRTM
jgi:hypothetical protein